ncbi:hypothetical protein ZWY2020_034518 [Hordeum vulgare]|nr:hypothetical protein ZWY2020_034518 [Hordeum vulgare]
MATMEQQTSNLTTLTEKLLESFVEENIEGGKHAEVQAAFNQHVSHEFKSPSKQIGLTQAEVDDICKGASTSASSTLTERSDIDIAPTAVLHTPPPKEGVQHPASPPPPPEPHAALHPTAPHPTVLSIPHAFASGQPPARLVNEGPPLLPRPAPPPAPPEHAHQHRQGRSTSPSHLNTVFLALKEMVRDCGWIVVWLISSSIVCLNATGWQLRLSMWRGMWRSGSEHFDNNIPLFTWICSVVLW